MTISKPRAVPIVLLVGLALGLSVFAASRLFIRSVLVADASQTAEMLAARLARGEPTEPGGFQSSARRYAYFAVDGRLLRSAALRDQDAPATAVSEDEMRRAVERAGTGGFVVEDAPLHLSLLGLAEPGVTGAAAPVVANGERIGGVFVEIDQAAARQTLTQAFTAFTMVSVAIAVLAIIAVAFLVTRGKGFAERRKLDANAFPRDALTGLPSRQGFQATLAQAVQSAKETDGQVGLMIVDLKGFRHVNEVWGHAAGDAVLRTAADRLAPFASGSGRLARLDSDRFALIMEGEANPGALRQAAKEICRAFDPPYLVGESTIALGAGIGAALFPINADGPEMLFRAADAALSKAKAEGRDAFAVFDTQMKEKLQRVTALERDLRLALERDEFVLFYQPQLELGSGRLRGYEALVRWERPGFGILAPREFLGVAEETGLIRPLGDWVLRKACADAASWLDAGIVAVNVCAAQFRFQEIDKTIAAVLAETGLPAERLEIEVPESLFLKQDSEVMETLRRIKALGVRVAMDDFGAGYSGLASLAQFPFDKVKIDRSFVRQLTEDADVAALVASIVGLGRSLSLDITAEGVETNEQVTLLKAAGCNIAQGFLFGMPKRETPHAADRPGDPRAPQAANAKAG